MVRSLRQRHRVIVFTLAALLPTAFVWGIALRQPVPAVPTLPGSLANRATRASRVLWERDDLWEKNPLRTRLLADATGGALAIELAARQPIARPDLLVYWLPGATLSDDRLPDGAVLLGAWSQNPVDSIPLPQTAKGTQGTLTLYSLADQEIVGRSKPFVPK